MTTTNTKINKTAEKVIDTFLTDWKERAEKYYGELYVEYNHLKNVRWALMEEYELHSYSSNYKRELASGKITQQQADSYDKSKKDINDFAEDLSKTTQSIIAEIPQYFEETLNKILNKEVKTKKFSLISRVTKKVGIITNADNVHVGVDGNLNGWVEGTEGKVNVSTIYAGGYNIQQLHYRVLLKKMK